jgi:hypothetical protein
MINEGDGVCKVRLMIFKKIMSSKRANEIYPFPLSYSLAMKLKLNRIKHILHHPDAPEDCASVLNLIGPLQTFSSTHHVKKAILAYSKVFGGGGKNHTWIPYITKNNIDSKSAFLECYSGH